MSIYISSADGHDCDQGWFRERLVWCSSSVARAAKKWAQELNHRLLTLDLVDEWDREKLDDSTIAKINADYAISEVHQNIGDDECFAAYDFSYTVDENKCIRPQIRPSAVLREVKQHGMVCWDTLHMDKGEQGRDTRYSLDAHENI
tara:strand:- start:38263 stop:38700 length:438 start_codon:yes stop_codon:yes gene_type:complete